MVPAGRVAHNLRDNGGRAYSVLSNFCNWLSFFSLGNVGCRPDVLAKLKGEMERSRAYSKGFFGVHNFKSSCMM